MNMYQVVIDEIRKLYGKIVKLCWIVDMKERNGIVFWMNCMFFRQVVCLLKWCLVIEVVL